jgi:hypothetical protein
MGTAAAAEGEAEEDEEDSDDVSAATRGKRQLASQQH